MTEETAEAGTQVPPESKPDAAVIAGAIGTAANAAIGEGNTQFINPTFFNVDPMAFVRSLVREGALSDPRLDAMFSPERQAVRDPEEVDQYLSNVEALIRKELIKAGDEHFVELSMKMAHSTSQSAAGSYFYRMAVNADDDQETIHDLAGLQEVLGTQPLVLLGIPGSGKSTVLHHLALRMIGAYREKKSNRLPFFVRLTEYQLTEGRAQPILKFLKSRAAALVGENHFIARDFEDLARANKFVFMFDGLDQMPDRRSETIRIKQLKKIEDELRRVDGLLKIARFFGRKNAVSRLLGSRQNVTTEAAPKVDPREEEIDRLPDTLQCAVITSCRQHDFIGVPRWQSLSILAMDTNQINEFIQLYAPGAEKVISPEITSSDSTRALITNPFYLRMLTQAFKEGLQDSDHSSQLKKALKRRGRLLEYLIRQGVYRYVARNAGGLPGPAERKARVDYILGKLGMLAYYMLERNVIGSVPNDALERILGNDLRPVIDAGVEGNLITIHEGEIGSIEFNHQLFLEFLLAFDLKQKAAREGGFEEALLLLSRRGDRWAETIRLLFEMVDEASREMLIEKFVQALRVQETWDISTRVLSDLGPRVAPYVAPLLQDTDEMAVTGATSILGKTNSQELAGEVVKLGGSDSWRVRRAAVEALAAMKLSDRLAGFENDRHPAVVRAVFRARLSLDESPAVSINVELTGNNTLRSEQMAFAVLDLFSTLLARLGEQDMLDLLRALIGHKDHDIRVLGFLMIGQSPDYFRRRLKSELRAAALEDDDAFVNVLARRAVSPFLDQDDLAQIQRLAPQQVEPNLLLWSRQDKKSLRAYWLLLEARELVSPSEYLNSLFYAPQAEVQLLTKKLGRRADSTSLSFLTFLLADKRTAPAAADALAGLNQKGVAYLLEALNDPSAQIRINVADLLKFCHLPKKYARQVRKNLRAGKIRTHEVRGVGVVTPGSDANSPSVGIGQMVGQLAGMFGGAFAFWLGAKLLGSHTTFGYWTRYALWSGTLPLTMDDRGQWWVRQVETLSFENVLAVRDADFWLARGRLERALGRKAPAKESLRKSLELRPDSAITRLELALIQWSLGNIGLAQETLDADGRKYLTKGSNLDALRRLLSIEELRAENPSSGDDFERMRLFDRLGLWPEAQGAALALLRKRRDLPEASSVLFRAYLGSKQTRRALAAAVAYNNQVSEDQKIRQVELEDLRWQHRSDSYPAMEIGAVEMAMDLNNDEDALNILRSLQILPASGMEISEDYIDNIQKLAPEVQAELRDLLSRAGNTEAAKSIITRMPLQQRLELGRMQ
ncbi:MAG TPA: NACHT domain-containing protein [Pyrinomonadaceae bacterium]|jgi:hypothetical protein